MHDPSPAGDLDVNVDWTASGPSSSHRDRSVSQFGNCTERFSANHVHREAAAEGIFEGAAMDFDFAEIFEGSNKYALICHGGIE